MNKTKRKTQCQNLWDATKEVHQGKFIALKCLYEMKDLKSMTSSFYHKKLEKEQIKFKVSQWKKLIKVKVEIGEIKIRETIEKNQ